MTQLIAGLYEIQNQIGAGGGGIVYLGRHTRLNKLIVLKADKRTLSVGTDKLRREVDMLKDLRQTYIPQVYDFVQENEVVYTVMDFIEGESLDKLLARKEPVSQPDFIKWACQLLEALKYLHSVPPHGILHGDIKPANIMLRPNGDICLIDFNIALALGEDGAVKVGFSRGYASPEHYGADYISANRPAAVGVAPKTDLKKQDVDDKTSLDDDDDRTLADDDRTLADDDDKTAVDDDKTEVEESVPQATPVVSTVGSITRSRDGIMLDARSDIYSLGATLYHLISGKRPAQDAREVVPLGADVCSPAVAAIIKKAMAPMPEDRYQTAEEMLNAFLQLHRKDKRVIKRRKRIITSVAMLSTMFLAGGAMTFVGLKQMEQQQEARALAEYSANALAEGDITTAVQQALKAIPSGNSVFEGEVTAEAQKALTDALGVYNLADGFHAMDSLKLPAAPFDVAVTSTGSRMAVVYGYEVAVYDMGTQKKLVALPIQESALSDALFVNEEQIIYAGDQGVTAYDLSEKKDIWTGEKATTLALSADGSILAAVDRDTDYATIYSVADGTVLAKCSFNGLHMPKVANDIFADPGNDILALNEDGSMLAVSFANGGLMIFDWKNPENDLILYDESEYKKFKGGFSGNYFAFAVEKSGEAEFGLVDIDNAEYVGGYSSQDSILLQADESGIFVANGSLLVELDPETMEEKELAYTQDTRIVSFKTGDKYTLVATDDNGFAFYDKAARLTSKQYGTEKCDFVVMTQDYAAVANRNETGVRLLQLESHEKSQLLCYDARYAHDEARISKDGKTAMLFDYKGFCIYDLQGELLAEVELPDAENIYDQQFRKKKDGSYLEVIWYDGTRRHYSATDGTVISEEHGKAPDKDLYEEFYTDKYRIASSLHDAPVVYDVETDEKLATLEEDAYLTYVTQMDDYLVTEYVSTEGERYGLLLNAKWEVLAYLPNLCDVNGNKFVFDYAAGDLRQVGMYSLDELVELGEAYN
ncbi:MAG: protein kinase [Lachnospiraceae bacterium]|nr:protein kinase [Lachnospiraceae bacterium]